jgi:hypothetical protein
VFALSQCVEDTSKPQKNSILYQISKQDSVREARYSATTPFWKFKSSMAYWASHVEESPRSIIQQEDGPNRDLGPQNCPTCHQPINESTDGLDDQRHCLQRDDARFKAVWAKEMGDVGEGSVYSMVSVLLVSWNDEAGDLKTGEEVRMLIIHDNRKLI